MRRCGQRPENCSLSILRSSIFFFRRPEVDGGTPRARFPRRRVLLCIPVRTVILMQVFGVAALLAHKGEFMCMHLEAPMCLHGAHHSYHSQNISCDHRLHQHYVFALCVLRTARLYSRNFGLSVRREHPIKRTPRQHFSSNQAIDQASDCLFSFTSVNWCRQACSRCVNSISRRVSSIFASRVRFFQEYSAKRRRICHSSICRSATPTLTRPACTLHGFSYFVQASMPRML